MNEVKNKNFILISCGACLVIVMLILYFSGLNVAKGSYGAEDLNEYTCENPGWSVYKEGNRVACCPSGYKFYSLNYSCIPNECDSGTAFGKCKVACKTDGTCDKRVETSGVYYYKTFEAVWKGKTCTKQIKYSSLDECNKATYTGYECECSYSTDLRIAPVDAIKKSSDPSPSPGDNKITIKFYNGKVLVKEKSCVKGSCESITAPGPQSITGVARSGYSFYNDNNEYEFNGWGSDSCLTTEGYGASYPAYHNFDNKSLDASVSYYACYREKKTASANSKCWLCLGTSGSVSSGGSYKWSAASPGSNCHAATDITAASCSGTPSPKKYECTLTDNSKVCVTAYDSAWAGASVSETGTSCREVSSCGGGTTPTNPDKPSSPSSPSIPSSTPSSTPSSSSNIDKNPPTGSIAIFMVWVIALGALVYSFFYFKQSRFE